MTNVHTDFICKFNHGFPQDFPMDFYNEVIKFMSKIIRSVVNITWRYLDVWLYSAQQPKSFNVVTYYKHTFLISNFKIHIFVMGVCNLHWRAKHQSIVHLLFIFIYRWLFAHKIKKTLHHAIYTMSQCLKHIMYIMNFSSEGVKYRSYIFGSCNCNSLTDLMVSSQTLIVA